MRAQSKGIGSADNSASIRCNIHTIPALLHCASHRRDNVRDCPSAAALAVRCRGGVRRSLFQDWLTRRREFPVQCLFSAQDGRKTFQALPPLGAAFRFKRRSSR